MSDDLFELDQTQRMSREQAAARLRALADSLSRHNGIEVERGGKRITIAVPDEVELGFEVEIGEDNEIEIEISW